MLHEAEVVMADEKQMLRNLAISAELKNAFDKHGATSRTVLSSYLTGKIEVEFQSDQAVCFVRRDDERVITVDEAVLDMKKSGKFDSCFAQKKLEPESEKPKILITDQEAMNRNLVGIARGDVEVIAPRKIEALKEGEIPLSDQAALNANIADIASGKRTVKWPSTQAISGDATARSLEAIARGD
jgi:hypothetical protein